MKAFLRRAILENVGLKVVSLALAVLLFLYVQGERRLDLVTTGALVDLSLVAPRGKVLTMDAVDKLSVNLRGPRSAIRRLMKEGIKRLTIDLNGWSPGPLRFTSAMLDVPRGLTVESIQPPQLDLAWESRASKTVPLLPRVSGKPANGYRITRVQVEPAEAKVSGPSSVVAKMASLELRSLRVEGYDQSVQLRLPVKVTRKYLTVRPAFARISVTINPLIVTRRLGQIRVAVEQLPADAAVEVRPTRLDEVLIEGPAPILSGVRAESLVASVSLADLGASPRPGRYRKPVRVTGFPPGCRVLSIKPGEVRVYVRRRVIKPEKEQEEQKP